MGRFQLELIYLYFPPSFHLIVVVSVLKQQLLDGRTVENKGKLILIVPEFRKISKLDVLPIKPATLWLLVRHTDYSANGKFLFLIQRKRA